MTTLEALEKAVEAKHRARTAYYECADKLQAAQKQIAVLEATNTSLREELETAQKCLSSPDGITQILAAENTRLLLLLRRVADHGEQRIRRPGRAGGGGTSMVCKLCGKTALRHADGCPMPEVNAAADAAPASDSAVSRQPAPPFAQQGEPPKET